MNISISYKYLQFAQTVTNRKDKLPGHLYK